MSFRLRLLLVLLLAALAPLVALTLLVRAEMTARLTTQVEARLNALTTALTADLDQESEAIAHALDGIIGDLRDDNRIRRALDGAPAERTYLHDYAGEARALTGLAMLQLQDAEGRILSSGHFRNAYDRLDPALPTQLLRLVSPQALVETRTPGGTVLALARAQAFDLGGRRYTLVGGIDAEAQVLAGLRRGTDLEVTLRLPTDTTADPDADAPRRTRAVALPFVPEDRQAVQTATVQFTQPAGTLDAIHASLNRWFGLLAIGAGLLTLGLAAWLAARFSRPVAALAEQASRLDLDRLDVPFDESRTDEVGALGRALGQMQRRLRTSRVRIQNAERRATMGDLARQVNHDIKNGLVPLRNVLRHLTRVSADAPGALPTLFQERRATLDASLAHLETLATHYARLSRRPERERCDLSAIARQAARDHTRPDRAPICTRLVPQAVVHADPVSLRRIVDNLVANALDSLPAGSAGEVMLSTDVLGGEAGAGRIRLTVADTGAGMTHEQLARVFEDFYTTKPDGTGLGLPIVRRLITDLGGTIRLTSQPGRGTQAIVELPTAS